MDYTISYKQPNSHLLHIELTFSPKSGKDLILRLPAWRPGRYELANYAKNIVQVKAENALGKTLPIKKTSRETWQLSAEVAEEVHIKYSYYAGQMDAGGSWLDPDLLFINFINCLFYIPGREEEACRMEISIPENFRVACGLPVHKGLIQAPSYRKLIDSPLLAAANISHLEYTVSGVPFHIWISGLEKFDSSKIVADFKAFTAEQLRTMKDFPENAYHFIFHALPYHFYHGVEHSNSTVVMLGPAGLFSDPAHYHNFLSISAHELFHAWNICKIRPKELLPYDLSAENYFPTGYVAEGFTTYYGDLFLIRSGVFSEAAFFTELDTTFKKHFENFGRLNLSLTESSFDLWVDGYVQGVPCRKVSIYVKGCIIALMLDLEIRYLSNGKHSLDNLMRLLWEDFGKKKKGYTSEDIKLLAEKITQNSFSDFFLKYIEGIEPEEEKLSALLSFVGCKLVVTAPDSYLEKTFGLRLTLKENKWLVDQTEPFSPADLYFSKGDEIQAIEGFANFTMPDSLTKGKKQVRFEFLRNGKVKELVLEASDSIHFPVFKVEKDQTADEEQKKQFALWLNVPF